MMSDTNDGFVFPLEVLTCPWSALDSYCRAGRVFLVDSIVALTELAEAVAKDNTSFLEPLMKEKKIWNAQVDEISSDVQCSFIIVQPYIFVEVPA